MIRNDIMDSLASQCFALKYIKYNTPKISLDDRARSLYDDIPENLRNKIKPAEKLVVEKVKTALERKKVSSVPESESQPMCHQYTVIQLAAKVLSNGLTDEDIQNLRRQFLITAAAMYFLFGVYCIDQAQSDSEIILHDDGMISLKPAQ